MNRTPARPRRSQLRPLGAGAFALAVLLALPASALSFLVGLALAAGHGPHRVFVHAASPCTDIVLAHGSVGTRFHAFPGEPPLQPADHPAPVIGGRCVSDEGAGDEHVICVSHRLDARTVARSDGDLPQHGATVLPLAAVRFAPALQPGAVYRSDARATLAPALRPLVLRL